MLPASNAAASRLSRIASFADLVAYLREDLEWEIPELPIDKLTYSYTADELGLKLDAQVEITQLRPILGQKNPWGVFFVDFDTADLPVTLLRRILSGVSRKKRSSANAADRALFDKNDLLFVSSFGKAEDRRLALAHFHQEADTPALPTLRVVEWDRQATQRHMTTVAERLNRLRWPAREELPETWKERWSRAFVDRPNDAVRTAKQMAEALAASAKQIRVNIQEILPREKPGQPLTLLFEAVKATLNKDLDGPKFADTYAQTIAYGLLSKRIDQVQRWRAEKAITLNGDLPLPQITVEALEAAIPTNPFLSELLTSFLTAGGHDRPGAGLDFDELGLGDVVDLLNTANMEAVLDDFDKDKQGDDPVIHFYEGFLGAYDKAMKIQRGVFYTPKSVVSFIVRSIDEMLRTELGLEDGLADTTTWGEFVARHPHSTIPKGVEAGEPFVKILDPATGTGTFLVEVIELIHRRLWDFNWNGRPEAEKFQLWNNYVPRHLLPRLYGYELMMAPYAVAHLKIGLKLADTGYDFSGTELGPANVRHPVRARVFLTNALEPAHELDLQLAFMNQALAHEAKAANEAKARARFTVVVGNPPYAGKSENPSRDRRGKLTYAGSLVRPFFLVNESEIKEKTAKWLNNDYVKFFALSLSAIRQQGIGIIGLITSNSWLDGIIFRGMRCSILAQMSSIRIANLHGNVKRRERCKDGSPDEGVFEIEEGTAIFIGHSFNTEKAVRIADVQGLFTSGGATKRRWLEVHTAYDVTNAIAPHGPNYWLARGHGTLDANYMNFPSLKDVLTLSGAGMTTARDHFVVGLSPKEVTDRVENFRDSVDSIEQVLSKLEIAEKDGWNATKARTWLRETGNLANHVKLVLYRPFDNRYICYHDAVVWRTAKSVMSPMIDIDNLAIVTTRQTKDHWEALATNTIITHKAVSGYDISSIFPLYRLESNNIRPNISTHLINRLEELVCAHFDDGSGLPTQVALPGVHLAWTAQPSLPLRRERGDLVITFGARDVFDWIYAVLHSAAFRERYAEFLKSDFARVPLPKDRTLFSDLVPLGARLIGLHLLESSTARELADPKVRFVNNGGEARLGKFGKEVRRDEAGRVYLNARCWFATVPQAAWERWIGGYQPAQKWLKDRAETGTNEKLRLGRLLSDDEVLHYRRMIVALDETAKVTAEVDKTIDRHGGWPGAFKGMSE